jgi:hypothetical protein
MTGAPEGDPWIHRISDKRFSPLIPRAALCLRKVEVKGFPRAGKSGVLSDESPLTRTAILQPDDR